ncbi:MAG TPA: sigma-70 family RNA polymerase sigma factor, partial [Thermoanaerobaculia bacterium]|nr:sigma-70 family RNA polymerase sigma factor [Thermoanaerobaculia bacterium]
PPGAWEALTPERLALSAEVRQVFDRALDDLPERQRAVVVLRDVEGLGSDEVCNVLEISETNQRVLLHRARARLREALAGLLERS